MPVAGGKAERDLLGLADVDAWLLEALDDPNRWVAAHVLLTMRHTEHYAASKSIEGRWNGLAVELMADGSSHIDEKQQAAIRTFWRSRLLEEHAEPSGGK
jgi:hypothetical protein